MRLPPRSECLQLVEATAPNVNGQAASAASEQTLDNLARAIGCSWQLWQLLQWSQLCSHLEPKLGLARREKRDTTHRRGPSAPGDLNAREAKKITRHGATATRTRRAGKPRLWILSYY